MAGWMIEFVNVFRLDTSSESSEWDITSNWVCVSVYVYVRVFACAWVSLCKHRRGSLPWTAARFWHSKNMYIGMTRNKNNNSLGYKQRAHEQNKNKRGWGEMDVKSARKNSIIM